MACRDDDGSSIDLSLKLRRNSKDSRDSFYVDFDQGIDSDIEEMVGEVSQRQKQTQTEEFPVMTSVTSYDSTSLDDDEATDSGFDKRHRKRADGKR